MRIDGRPALPLTGARPLCAGQTLAVGSRGRAAIHLAGADTVLRLDENSVIRLETPPEPESGVVGLLRGALYFLSQVRRSLTVETPYLNAGIEGTEVLLRLPGPTAADAGELLVFDGAVTLSAPGAPRDTARSGDIWSLAPEGGARLVRREAGGGYGSLRKAARDRMAWTLHYPDLLVADEAGGDERILRAAALLRGGRALEARALLEAIVGPGRSAALRDALLAVIAGAQGDPDEALALGRRAQQADASSATAALALSFAHQLQFDLEAARQLAAQASELAPGSAIAWARRAELDLMTGRSRAAREAAFEARSLGDNALTETVLGYTALSTGDALAARHAFSRALLFDSELPDARLGLGLALIRAGDLKGGRAQIEIAAAHDPDEALLRSYLGKAYFEERRDRLAGDELGAAKILDPQDPTAYFYDALRLQLDSRPVEALRELERAIARNDNRALYRSRQLLDADRALRGVSLGRIFAELGFTQLGEREAARSLLIDPAEPAAHRFLADAYLGRPRHEIARVSELLQSRLLDESSSVPIQPGLVVSDIEAIARAGPGQASFAEFGSLFERDGATGQVTGLVGNNKIRGGEAVVGLRAGRFALNGGLLAQETDGFRDNAGSRSTVADLLAEVQLTPELAVEGEYRLRDSKRGDLTMDFDPDIFDASERNDIDQRTGRVGLRWRPDPSLVVVATALTTERDERQVVALPPLGNVLADEEDKGEQAEAQAIWSGGPVRLIVGGGVYDVDVDSLIDLPFPLADTPSEFERRQQTGYAYAHWSPLPELTLTMGVSALDFEQGDFDQRSVDPKLGISWQVADGVRVRAAAFRTTKRALVTDETLEPTNVAGFNQFFDDFNGTEAWRYGTGLDFRPRDDLFLGVEVSQRDYDVPVVATLGGKPFVFADRRERELRAYAYWIASDQLAFAIEPRLEQFERQKPREVDEAIPLRLLTVELPLQAAWFDPRGWFARAGVTWLYQELDREPGSTLADGSAYNLILDAEAGYRLPERRGLLSLRVENLLDEEIEYRDDNFRSSEVRTPRFTPGRTIIGRVTVVF